MDPWDITEAAVELVDPSQEDWEGKSPAHRRVIVASDDEMDSAVERLKVAYDGIMDMEIRYREYAGGKIMTEARLDVVYGAM